MARRLFTSESVTEGHPDKVADQISDAVLDEILALDPEASVAAETLVTTGLVLVAGEITTQVYVDVPRIVRDTVRGIGYTRAKFGFDADTCAVLTSIDEQSPDIRAGVQHPLEERTGRAPAGDLGAGDQGVMFGYACRETETLMPLPIALAHALARRLAEVRKSGRLPYLWPDGKTQVTVAYEDDEPVGVEAVVVSAQHAPDVGNEELETAIRREVVEAVVPGRFLEGARVFVNPSGRFVVGGPQADTGLTGRKIIVDTYGGYARHGGGALSGKDPTKVDRSAAYAARYVAKNLVAAGLCDRAEVQLAYAIGVAEPVAVRVDSFGTGRLTDERLEQLVRRHFDLRPAAIIRTLGLRRPIYRPLAAYGHFGRTDVEAPWERTDVAEALRADAAVGGAMR
ncbi:MAG: methionine adenosyltransferase [Firmicutes bacterium]|nr:methionine adenosyltransferase [Bacillota bacterium]